MKELVFFDVESTGKDKEDRLIQLAFAQIDGAMEREPSFHNRFYKPPLPIKIEAMAVHHITEKRIADSNTFMESSEYDSVRGLFSSDGVIVIAHNAKFDVAMLEKEGIVPKNVICTLKVARYLDKNGTIPSHALQYLRYYLGLEIEAEAHDAMGDVMVLFSLFKRLYEKMGGNEEALEKMIEISSHPSMIARFAFGKYKGEKIADIANQDRGYLDWLYDSEKKKEEPDEDMIYTIEKLLA